jgi:type VI protein secretion system component VasK
MEIEEIELTGDELLEAIKLSGLDKSFQAYVKNKLQVEGDRRLSEGLKTYQANQSKKNLSDSEKITNLENELKEMKDNNSKNSLNNSIKVSLKEAGLSEGFANYIKVEKPEDIEAAIKDLSDNILGLKQSEIDNKLKGNEPPAKGNTGIGGDSTLKSYVESKNKGEENSPFGGKITKKEGE